MPPSPPRRRRARPVADAPLETLLARTSELATGWLVALIEQGPLQSAPRLLDGGLVQEGPHLCGAVLRALADDRELARLEPEGALAGLAARTGELAGASGDPVRAVQAVDALGEVLWTGLLAELRAPEPDLIAELGQRLALVCGVLRVAALRRGATLEAARDAPEVRKVAEVPEVPEVPEVAEVPDPEPVAPRRSPSADALWVGALEDELRRTEGLPLSLLLVEMEESDRVSATGSPAAASAAFEHFAQAVRSVVRHQDILVSESDSRAWIIARDTPRSDAQALGSRVAEAVRAAPARGGVPLSRQRVAPSAGVGVPPSAGVGVAPSAGVGVAPSASVGVAVFGEDGLTSSQLIEAAEEARFAASASGTGVAR